MTSTPSRRGMTLIELVVVLLILVVLASLVVPLVSDLGDQSRVAATRDSLHRLQELIMNRYWPDMKGVLVGTDGYPQPDPNNPQGRQLHPQLYFLFISPGPGYDPVTRRGWNGPYLQHGGGQYAITGSFTNLFGENGDPTVLDGWSRPIVLQRPTVGSTAEQSLYTRLVSAGPDGVINTPADQLLPAKSICGDDLVLYLRTPDQRPD